MTRSLAALAGARFSDLGDGTWLDLATGSRAWVERRVLDAEAAGVWPGVVSRLWDLWHPAIAACLDYGWLPGGEWFEAYLAQPTTMAQAASAQPFLAHFGVDCAVQVRRGGAAGAGALVPCPPGPSADDELGRDAGGIGMHLVARPLEAHLIEGLDSSRGGGPRVWPVDAEPGCGWRTCWRRVAREARLRGYAAVDARILQSAVRRVDGRVSSWLALLEPAPLLVRFEQPDWSLARRRALAGLLVRLGGVDGPASVVLDVVRRGRPRAAPHQIAGLAVDELAGALWVTPACSPHWLRRRRTAEACRGLPGCFVSAVARRLGLETAPPLVHETAPAFGDEDADSRPADHPAADLRRAAALVTAGRPAAAARHLMGASAARARRGDREAGAALLGEAAVLAAQRGDLAVSRRLWRRAADIASAPGAPALQAVAAVLAEQWIRQGALVDAERLARAMLSAAALLGDEPPPALRAALAACLCWQARWADALAETGTAADAPPQLLAARVWPRLELGDTSGALVDLGAAVAADPDGASSSVRAARLRVEIALGTIDRRGQPTGSYAGMGPAPPAIHADDVALLPVEGQVRHGVEVSEAWQRALRGLVRPDVPRLVRARARLVLALSARGSPRRDELEREVARVVTATRAQALLAGRSRVSPWPARTQEGGPMLDDLVAVLRACQSHDDPRTALADVCRLLQARLDLAAVLVAGWASGGLMPLASAGRHDLLALSRRAVDVGRRVAQSEAGATDWATPSRLGDRVVGVVACHWVMQASEPGAAARTLLDAAATAMAPTIRLGVEIAESVVPRADQSSLIGVSQAMDSLRAAVDAAARVPFTVLIEGESGSGKELVARELHRLGPRRARSFCAVNCAALTDDLCEAELFGHARGAFTGAVGERPGLFEEADGGTLFLDEVSELSPRAQAKLLRALQEGEVRRLGETRPRRVDVRVVAATNRSLAAAVAAGAFRADLRYRLDVIHIAVPALRERPEDVPLLARHFWARAAERVGTRARLLPETLAALARYDWPGNVRELQNTMAALSARAPRHGVVRASALPAAHGQGEPLGGVTLEQARRVVDERLVRAALAQTGGHRGKAASALGLSRQGFAKLVDRLKLDLASGARLPPS